MYKKSFAFLSSFSSYKNMHTRNYVKEVYDVWSVCKMRYVLCAILYADRPRDHELICICAIVCIRTTFSEDG